MASVDGAQSPRHREFAEWKSGGRTVLFGALGYGGGPILFLTTASIFVKPTIQASGWNTSQVLISPLVTLFITLLGPLVGRVVDKRGVRRAIVIGLVPYAILLILFAVLPVNRLLFYALAVGIGLFGSFGYLVPYNRAVASWFDKGAGKAFSIIGVGGAAMPLIGIPLVTLAIYGAGWQAGYLVLAAFALFLALPAALFGVKERIDHTAVVDTDETRELNERAAASSSVQLVLRTPRFWIFSLHIFLMGAAGAAFLANMQPIMLDGGLSVTAATTVTTLFTMGIIFGRLASGLLLDLVNRYHISVVVFTISGLGALTLTDIKLFPTAVIAAAALLTSVGQGAEGDIGAYFILKEYGHLNFGALYATASVFGGIGALLFPYLFGFIRDTSGGYTNACLAGAALYVASALAIVTFGILGRNQSRRIRGVAA